MKMERDTQAEEKREQIMKMEKEKNIGGER